MADGLQKSMQLEHLIPLSVVLQPGVRVYLRGLQTARHLNCGVAACVEQSGVRWLVEVDSGGKSKVEPKNMIPERLALREGAPAYLTGLESAPELNGTLGICRRV